MKFSVLLLLALGATYGNNVAMCTATPPSGGPHASLPNPGGPGTGAENQGQSQAGQQLPSPSGEPGAASPTHTPSPGPLPPNPAQPNSLPAVETLSQQGGGATQLQATPKKAELQSSLLKNFTGVKVTGPCDTEVGLYLIPYIYISVNAQTDTIELSTRFPNSDNMLVEFKKEGETLTNVCGGSSEKTFKFIMHLEDSILTLKWIVNPQSTTANKNKADVRKYKVPELERPITSIQVHSVLIQEDTVIYKSKDYSVKTDIPEKCEQVASACFLSGNTDIESCYTCNLLIHNEDTSDKCFDYVSSEFKNQFQDIKVKGQDDEESSEYKLAQTIDAVLSGIYKKDQNGKKELLTWGEVDPNVKEQISSYCHLLKDVDASGSLEVHQMGSEMDIFNNLITLLQKHSEEQKATLEWKLQNPALCLKDANNWVVNKKGLLLPLLQNGGSAINFGESNHVEDVKKDNLSTYQEGPDGVIDLSVVHQNAHASSTPFTNHMFCNSDYCDRAKDTSSCMAKIEVQDQGDCSTSWLFASKVHLEAIKCMKGHDHVGASALYVANCSNKEAKDKCHSPSNPLEFLNTLEETKFLPAESDLPYSYKAVNNVCPEPKSHWKNLWSNVKLLDPTNEPNAVSSKGYTAYQSDHFKGNLDAFIKLVKSQVMSKGSVIAYVKADDQMGYDLNGKKILSLCGSETPDLAVNIVGYGNYITAEGQKKSYWLLQNSWGKHWGDKGTFKVDMHGPAHCQHNFIHTAVVFNLDVPLSQSPAKDTELYSYHLKSSPDFYKNLYYNAVGAEKGSALSQAVHGQEDPQAGGTLPGATAEGGEKDGQASPGQQPQQDASSVGGQNPQESRQEVEEKQVVDGQPQPVTVEGHPPSQPLQPTSQSQQSTQPGVEGAASTPPAQGTPGQANSNGGAENANISQIIHVLKHIKKTKMVTRIVTYEGEYDLGDHSCSRTQASSLEKLDDCIKFCNDNLSMCERTVSPGYCLTKLRKANDCIFCFV
uniref:Putative papain-like cysteine prorease n=1 Tax=Plasmodium vivax TaxID=5855 RepID=A0A0E4B3L0_PLAVI|nr:putative papain-like cysteine prorease [Plasmodium vivax]BAR42422.1 putative papain-like cysteine prorease [Plasmodium vivax]